MKIRYPAKMTELPYGMEIVNEPADQDDVQAADATRKEYFLEIAPNPYMVDITRAFRLAKGASVYIEVGTQDKGNIAWLARTKLAARATIIDIDCVEYPANEMKIIEEMRERGLNYHALRGDCLSDNILDEVKSILGDRKADLIFCDSHYTYEHTMSEFSLYFPLVKPNGYLFFHDSIWSGDKDAEWPEMRKRGKGFAIADLDRFYPAYLVHGWDDPVRRFSMPPQDVTYWGTVAIFPSN